MCSVAEFRKNGWFFCHKVLFPSWKKDFFHPKHFFLFPFSVLSFFWTHREHQTGLIVSFSVTFKLVFLSHLFYWGGTYFRKRSQPLSFLGGFFVFSAFFFFFLFIVCTFLDLEIISFFSWDFFFLSWVAYLGINIEPLTVITHISCSSFFMNVFQDTFIPLWECELLVLNFVGLSHILTLMSGCTNKLSAAHRWVQKPGLRLRRGGVRWIKEQCGKGGISRWSSWDQHQEEKCQIYRIQCSPGKHGGTDAHSHTFTGKRR